MDRVLLAVGVKAPRTFRQRWGLVPVAALILGAAVLVPSGSAQNPPSFRLDHYLCYTVTSATPFETRVVEIRDRVGRRQATVVKPSMLCNPVSKNGGELRDREAHLACYQIKTTGRLGRLKIRNQYARRGARLRGGEARQLCLPSGKRLADAGAPPAIPQSIDHFTCYTARHPFQPRNVRLRDQFGRVTGRVRAPGLFCAPTNKNGEGIRNREDHLTCYSLDIPTAFQPLGVVIANQFGPAQWRVEKRRLLCLPSKAAKVRSTGAHG